MEIKYTTEKLLVLYSVLSGSEFRDAAMDGCVFDDINLQGSTFENINLSNVSMTDCDISGLTIEGVVIADLLQQGSAASQVAIAKKGTRHQSDPDLFYNIRRIESLETPTPQSSSDTSKQSSIDENGAHNTWVADACISITCAAPEERVGTVLGYSVHEPARKPEFDEIFSVLEREQVNKIRFRVLPTPYQEQIIEWLTARGLRQRTKWVQWIAYTDLERSIETEFTIRQVGEEYATRFAEIIAENYRSHTPEAFAHYKEKLVTPDVTCFMAFEGETPVGTGVLNSHGRGCSLGYGTTLRPYRKRGLQNAMIAYRLNHAFKLGHAWACASTMGNDRSSRNLQRQGFKKAYDFYTYGADPA